MTLTMGIDLGTSGVRICIINQNCAVIAQASSKPFQEPTEPEQHLHFQDPTDWWAKTSSCIKTTESLLKARGMQLADVSDLAVCGTSGSICALGDDGRVLGPALMYDSSHADLLEVHGLTKYQGTSPAVSQSGTIGRCLWHLQQDYASDISWFCHQADYIAYRLGAAPNFSDENNCLKLGYDPEAGLWIGPAVELVGKDRLPRVVCPGDIIGRTQSPSAQNLGFSPQCLIKAGTTDSVAAFLASNQGRIGEGTTSLGTTLVLKMLSTQNIVAPDLGVYSHKFGTMWLSGGASNAGGGSLLQHFSLEQIKELSRKIDPDRPTLTNYYPLPKIGERFPINDPEKISSVEPRLEEDTRFLQALFEGLAAIEAKGYQVLHKLGCPKLTSITTSGGGAKNKCWQMIRTRYCKVPIASCMQDEPSYGTALLARLGINGWIVHKEHKPEEC